MSKTEGSCSKAVGYRWLYCGIITMEVSIVVWFELELGHQLISQKHRQELRVGDVLQLSYNNPPGFLEHPLISPCRVEGSQFVCHQVVLSSPQKMHCCEMQILIGPRIPWKHKHKIQMKISNVKVIQFLEYHIRRKQWKNFQNISILSKNYARWIKYLKDTLKGWNSIRNIKIFMYAYN